MGLRTKDNVDRATLSVLLVLLKVHGRKPRAASPVSQNKRSSIAPDGTVTTDVKEDGTSPRGGTSVMLVVMNRSPLTPTPPDRDTASSTEERSLPLSAASMMPSQGARTT